MISVVHGNHLERHLYDTIPNAWKELGKNDIPLPIPEVRPASAIKGRRMSVPVHKVTDSSQIPPVFTAGRRITRRMSTYLEEHPGENIFTDSDEHLDETIHHRQSVRPDSSPKKSIKQPKIGLNKETKKCTRQKQKSSVDGVPELPDLSIDSIPPKISFNLRTETSNTATTKPQDDSVFKVPAIPPKGKNNVI